MTSFLFVYLFRILVLQRQIFKNPTPTLTLPLKGRGFYGVFSLHGGDFMGFSHFHASFSNPSPFKGEVRRGMGYICRCSIRFRSFDIVSNFGFCASNFSFSLSVVLKTGRCRTVLISESFQGRLGRRFFLPPLLPRGQGQ